jgi:TPR repeat protein
MRDVSRCLTSDNPLMKLKHSVIYLLLATSIAWAGPFEDALSSLDRKDYISAAKGFRLAAEQGEASAQFNLGVMYRQGQGVLQDDAEAVKWYRLAAAQGHADAQFNLGVVYDNGQGVLQDYVRAHLWFNVAAAKGDSDAAKNRDIAASKMTSQQIGEAQKLARQCLARDFKGCN